MNEKERERDTPSECFDRGYLGGSLQGHADGYEMGYNDAATRMRDACVGKVREMCDEWQEKHSRLNSDAELIDRLVIEGDMRVADEIITALSSLTLDQMEQENTNGN